MKYLVLCLVLGCASWAPTREAQARRAAEWDLEACLPMKPIRGPRNFWFTRQCIEESRERCKAQGLEATCGEGKILFGDVEL